MENMLFTDKDVGHASFSSAQLRKGTSEQIELNQYVYKCINSLYFLIYFLKNFLR